MLHRRWNKSGQGMPTTNEVGRIHCKFGMPTDANGTWDNFMKNNIGNVMQDMEQETTIPLLYILKLFRITIIIELIGNKKAFTLNRTFSRCSHHRHSRCSRSGCL